METLTLIPSVPNLPLFFILYLIIYLIAYFIIFRKWTQKLRPEVSSCIISLAHGTPAVFLASHSLLSHQHNLNFSSQNTPPQALVLDYSIAYFLMDLAHYIIFFPNDLLFIAHHLATLFVFVTCRYVVFHGAYGILVLLILAEVTSFCQNAWTLSNVRRLDLDIAAKVNDFLSPPFYALYSIARGLLGPAFVYKMLVFYLSGAADDVIPRWIWVSWIVVIVMAISVSILWVSNLWVELYTERKGKVGKKIK